jgi:holo-[acyl-carrier protein] synthase
VFTDEEMRYCRGHSKTTERFAALWAAKEAVLKTLGIRSVKNLAWTDAEIIQDATSVAVRLQGSLKAKADRKKVGTILVTTAHCRTHATAYAIALRT